MKTAIKSNKSKAMSLAHKYLRAIPMAERTDSTWSELLTKAWYIVKNPVVKVKKVLTFDEVYNTYKSDVMNYIAHYMGKRVDSIEEMTNDVFFKAYEHFGTFDKTVATYKTWLITMARNKAVDYWRSKEMKRKENSTYVSDFVNENGVEAFEFEADNYDENSIENIELRDGIVSKGFRCLKGNAKKIAMHSIIDGMKQAEIATLLDIPLGTVKVTLKRAKVKMAEALQNEYNEMYS